MCLLGWKKVCLDSPLQMPQPLYNIAVKTPFAYERGIAGQHVPHLHVLARDRKNCNGLSRLSAQIHIYYLNITYVHLPISCLWKRLTAIKTAWNSRNPFWEKCICPGVMPDVTHGLLRLASVITASWQTGVSSKSMGTYVSYCSFDIFIRFYFYLLFQFGFWFQFSFSYEYACSFVFILHFEE